MRLTEEEKKQLADDIMNDLPEDFAVFSPWTSMFLVQIFSLLISGVAAVVSLEFGFNLSPPLLLAIIFFVVCPAVIVPNMMMAFGYGDWGVRLVRISAPLFFVVSVVGTIADSFQNGKYLIGGLIGCLLAGLTLFITYTVRFRAFLLHRSRMAAWSKERMRKNKAFKEAIKQKRRGR